MTNMSNERPVSTQKRTAYVWTATLLLGLLFAQAMTSIPRLSITFDEDLHISTGYSVLRTGDLRLVEDHPPLIGLLTSWPLLLSTQVPDPQQVPAWEQGDRRLFVRNEIWWDVPLDAWVVPPRIPVSWLAMLLGVFLFRWASDWFGPGAGLLALAFFVFDPNILAHGTLATLDLGVTCFIFIAMYGLQRLLRRPSWLNLIAGGVLLGMALAAKVSALLLLPISAGLMVLWSLARWREGKGLALRLPVYLGVAFLTLWAFHLFDVGPPPGLSFPLPVPTYLNSFLRVGRHVARGNPAYLLGETYVGGRWYYFPVVFALKTPLPTLALSAVAGGVTLLAAWRSPQQRWRALLVASFPVAYFLLSIVNEINLGYRHLLPIVPFLYLSIAYLAHLALSLSSRHAPRTTHHASRVAHRPSRLTFYVLRFTFYVLLLWQAVGTLRTWPFYLTYFNEIAGGPENGYRYLADSNVDWGQGLKALRDYLGARSWPDVRLSSFTWFIRPELYGVQAAPLPPLADAPAVLPTRLSPAPGTYVISGSTLRGLQTVDREMYNWFWHREPDDIVANALLVYRVREREPRPAWLAQCTVPAIPLSPEAVIEGFGRADLRLLTFDCTQSWLYPDAGASSGWYVLHREAAVREDSYMRQQLAPARLSFEQKTPRTTPPLSVFEWNGLEEIEPPREGGRPWAAPVEWPPAQALADGVPVSAPVLLDGPLTFLGYEVIHEDEDRSENGGQMIDLATYWRVIDSPDRPFSLMGHLVGADGIPVAVGDGLGISWEQLQPGDLLVQRHPLSVPQDLVPDSLWLQTGAYWLDTMERWTVLTEGEIIGDRILLTPPEAFR
jgi:4-amino-4-deoxy-L-arabinose transferase-like glycosyltransferase